MKQFQTFVFVVALLLCVCYLRLHVACDVMRLWYVLIGACVACYNVVVM